MVSPFSNLGKYGAILADVPWDYKYYSVPKDGQKFREDSTVWRAPDVHYPCMSLDEIKNLPVAELAAENCTLFFWATYPFLPAALDIIKTWGFTYKTVAFTWIKKNKNGGFFVGLGYWSRANAEVCLLATAGKPKRLNRDVRQLIISQRREHSRKPDEQYERIERLVAGPYVELFARQERDGWDCWGNEIRRAERG